MLLLIQRLIVLHDIPQNNKKVLTRKGECGNIIKGKAVAANYKPPS